MSRKVRAGREDERLPLPKRIAFDQELSRPWIFRLEWVLRVDRLEEPSPTGSGKL